MNTLLETKMIKSQSIKKIGVVPSKELKKNRYTAQTWRVIEIIMAPIRYLLENIPNSKRDFVLDRQLRALNT